MYYMHFHFHPLPQISMSLKQNLKNEIRKNQKKAVSLKQNLKNEIRKTQKKAVSLKQNLKNEILKILKKINPYYFISYIFR